MEIHQRTRKKRWQKNLATFLLILTIMGSFGSVSVQAEEADYVVVVAEQTENKEPIVWRPFYVSLAVLIVTGGGIIHICLTKRRKQEEKTGKRGL